MIRHYIKIFFRNLGRYRLYSTINFASLVLGIGFALSIYLFIESIQQDDTFHERYSEVYRLIGTDGSGSTTQRWPERIVEYAQKEIPGVERAFVHSDLHNLTVRSGDREFEEDILAASPGLLDVLSFEIEWGNQSSALESADAVYLTQEKALKLFGNPIPLGEKLEIYYQGAYRELYVDGIVRDFPSNASIRPDVMVSTRFIAEVVGCGQSDSNQCTFYTDLLIRSGDTTVLEEQSETVAGDLSSRFGLSGEKQLVGLSLERWLRAGNAYNVIIYSIWLLALLVLGISCITYVNNTIAATTTRFREIGVRKVMGSDRRGIAMQFMVESVLSVLIALGLSLLLLELFVPFLESYLDTMVPEQIVLSTEYLYRRETIPVLLGLVLVTALMAGAWPAAVLSGFKPATVLKSQHTVGGSPVVTRYLVGFQMVFSMVIFVLALHTGNSLHRMDADYYGYNSDGLVAVPVLEPDSEGVNRSIFGQFTRRMSESGINRPVAGTRGAHNGSGGHRVWEEGREIQIHVADVTFSFFELLEMEISESTPIFNQRVTRDSAYVVINPILLARLGWNQGIGRIIDLDGKPHTVLGVLEGFNGFEGGDTRIPFAFRLIPETSATTALVHTRNAGKPKAAILSNLRSAREDLKRKDRPVAIYSSVSFTSQGWLLELILDWSLPVVIFCLALAFLGLFSLTSFSVTRRLKEISIRKVNGAMPGELVRMLGREYLLLGAGALVLALPLGYIATNSLVGAFTDMELAGSFFGLFILSLVSMLTFILSCVGWQVWTASNVNPVKYLKEDQ